MASDLRRLVPSDDIGRREPRGVHFLVAAEHRGRDGLADGAPAGRPISTSERLEPRGRRVGVRWGVAHGFDEGWEGYAAFVLRVCRLPRDVLTRLGRHETARRVKVLGRDKAIIINVHRVEHHAQLRLVSLRVELADVVRGVHGDEIFLADRLGLPTALHLFLRHKHLLSLRLAENVLFLLELLNPLVVQVLNAAHERGKLPLVEQPVAVLVEFPEDLREGLLVVVRHLVGQDAPDDSLQLAVLLEFGERHEDVGWDGIVLRVVGR
mmetsp:Transcript_33006/g.61367  ORF Transcript_33006/g.61367 Transcript_33006/m.61367 type:complete len:266 (-) Transcript_33006:281-1078(-)